MGSLSGIMESSKVTSFLSGYIEGYYGRLLSFEERLGIVRKLREIKSTHYLYAPKEDPLHRREWRKPYPPGWQRKFKSFVTRSRRLGISVTPGLAPGLSFRYQSAEDFDALIRKFRVFIALGCDELALLMDDIPTELPQADKGVFQSLGEAHAALLQQLQKRLSDSGDKIRWWFCPTVYCDAFSKQGVRNDRYLQDLSREIPANVRVMWTGPAVVSRRLAPSDLNEVRRVLGRRAVLWDNLYANDYCPGKIFLGPFLGRASSLRRASAGLLLNPTGLYQTDLFLLDLLGGFLRGESSQSVWKTAIRQHEIPPGFLKISRFLASPFEFPVPSGTAIPKLRQALKPLLWDWKSPLQREWYPYLYALDADLRLLSEGDDKPDAAWIRKKYPPILSSILTKHSRP